MGAESDYEYSILITAGVLPVNHAPSFSKCSHTLPGDDHQCAHFRSLYYALMVDALFEELPTEMECTASGLLFYVGEV